MASLAQETEAYQALLEGVRANPFDEELAEDLQKAEIELTLVWWMEQAR